MYAQMERSCWGAAKWTLLVFFVVAGLVYLLGGADSGQREVTQHASVEAVGAIEAKR